MYIHIRTGLKIDYWQYSRLSPDEKRMFRQESISSNGTDVEIVLDSMFNDSSSFSISDNNLSNDSSGFDEGFGGGDFSGGGSGGDW